MAGPSSKEAVVAGRPVRIALRVPRKRGRSAQANGEASPREEILKAAAALFSVRGYAGTTMAQIADMVGIRSPSLYYHFTDKAHILEAIADMTLEKALEDSKRLLGRTEEPPTKRLYLLVHDLVFQLCESEYEMNCMFDPAFHGPEFDQVNGKLIAWLKDMETLIRQGIDRGEFEKQNTKVAAASVRGLLESGIRKHGGYSKLSSIEAADYVARFAMKGLIAPGRDLDTLLV
jgi:AcrR family transcriptional regulator